MSHGPQEPRLRPFPHNRPEWLGRYRRNWLALPVAFDEGGIDADGDEAGIGENLTMQRNRRLDSFDSKLVQRASCTRLLRRASADAPAALP
jgi:hypothetical protein